MVQFQLFNKTLSYQFLETVLFDNNEFIEQIFFTFPSLSILALHDNSKINGIIPDYSKNNTLNLY